VTIGAFAIAATNGAAGKALTIEFEAAVGFINTCGTQETITGDEVHTKSEETKE
jgi:hypothetical protein